MGDAVPNFPPDSDEQAERALRGESVPIDDVDPEFDPTPPPDTQHGRIITPAEHARMRMLYIAKPDRWLKMATGEDVWWKQRDIMRAVALHPRVCVAAANSTGKSFLASRLVLWFLTLFTNATVITTAPDNRRVEDVMWGEINRAWDMMNRRGIRIGDKPLTVKWKLSDNRLAVGFAPKEYDETAMQGYHNRNMLIIVDEASGVSDVVHKGVDSVVRGSTYHILRIGNPTNITGEFYRSFKKSNWYSTNISAFDSPNVIERKSLYPGIVTSQDVEDARIEYGEGSWEWRVFIEGKFPDREPDTLIAIDWCADAAKTSFQPIQMSREVEVGADIARFGSDRIVFAAQRGFHAFYFEEYKHKRTTETAALLLEFCDKVRAKTVRIDTVGVGAGVADAIFMVKPKHLNVVEMVGSARAQNPLKYANSVTEWWDHTARLLEDHIATGPIYGNKLFVADLVSRKAPRLRNSLMQLESKDEVKIRIRRSPDYGDAIVMANASGITGTVRKHIRAAILRH